MVVEQAAVAGVLAPDDLAGAVVDGGPVPRVRSAGVGQVLVRVDEAVGAVALGDRARRPHLVVRPDRLAARAVGVDVDAHHPRRGDQAQVAADLGAVAELVVPLGQVVAGVVLGDQALAHGDQRVLVRAGALLEDRHLADDALLAVLELVGGPVHHDVERVGVVGDRHVVGPLARAAGLAAGPRERRRRARPGVELARLLLAAVAVGRAPDDLGLEVGPGAELVLGGVADDVGAVLGDRERVLDLLAEDDRVALARARVEHADGAVGTADEPQPALVVGQDRGHALVRRQARRRVVGRDLLEAGLPVGVGLGVDVDLPVGRRRQRRGPGCRGRSRRRRWCSWPGWCRRAAVRRAAAGRPACPASAGRRGTAPARARGRCTSRPGAPWSRRSA